MPRKVFVAGEILTAADVNTNLMDQAVMSFAGTAARGSAIPSPVEGMVTYLNDADRLEVYTNAWKPVGSVLQVVSTAKTDTFTTTSASYTAVTGLSASITPSSTSSKILVVAQVSVGLENAGTGWGHFRLSGGNTSAYVGDASGSRVQSVFGGNSQSNLTRDLHGMSIVYLDSPATTSAVTYQVEARTAGNGSARVNITPADSNDAQGSRGASSITVLEVAG
jgi:hypothetical protein